MTSFRDDDECKVYLGVWCLFASFCKRSLVVVLPVVLGTMDMVHWYYMPAIVWVPSIDRFAIKIIEATLQPNRNRQYEHITQRTRYKTYKQFTMELNGKSSKIPISLCK